MEKESILVVDNDESLLHLLQLFLEDEGYNVLLAQSTAEALALVAEALPGVALLDRVLDPPLRRGPVLGRRSEHVARPGVAAPRRRSASAPVQASPPEPAPNFDGLALARQLRQRDPLFPIILMTAHATIQSAWEAGQLGVYYLTKPFATRELAQLLVTVLRERRLQQHRNS